MRTLNDFKNKYDIERVSAIYICDSFLYQKFSKLLDDDDLSLDSLSELNDYLQDNYENIILRDEFLKEENGKTKVDMNKILNKYKGYIVWGGIPKISEEDITEDSSFEDIMQNAKSYTLLLKKKVSAPRINSTVNGYCVFNFELFDNDVTTSSGNRVSGSQLLCGIFDDEVTAYEYIRKRKNQMSLFYRVKNGKPVSSTVRFYKTNQDGSLEEVV